MLVTGLFIAIEITVFPSVVLPPNALSERKCDCFCMQNFFAEVANLVA